MAQPTVAQSTVGHAANASNGVTADIAYSASAAFQELAKAYQALATRNAGALAAAVQALSAVKNPGEFIEVQQKLIKDGVQAAVSDSQNIAHLTAAVFTATFDPVKRQIEAAQNAVRH